MKTVVYQSYRTEAVPAWIARCMETVRAWAGLRGYDYRFIDDALLGYAPEWYRDKVRGDIRLISDLARLKLAKELLDQGYERTIWMDADIVVFDAERLVIDVREECAFCREVWISRGRFGRTRGLEKVNNSVSVFVKENNLLDLCILACESLVRYEKGRVKGVLVGTNFLTNLNRTVALHLLDNVGLFSPILMQELAKGGGKGIRAYMRRFGSPLYAANLCGSAVGRPGMNEQIYADVVPRLLRSRGAIVNDYLGA